MPSLVKKECLVFPFHFGTRAGASVRGQSDRALLSLRQKAAESLQIIILY